MAQLLWRHTPKKNNKFIRFSLKTKRPCTHFSENGEFCLKIFLIKSNCSRCLVFGIGQDPWLKTREARKSTMDLKCLDNRNIKNNFYSKFKYSKRSDYFRQCRYPTDFMRVKNVYQVTFKTINHTLLQLVQRLSLTQLSLCTRKK